MIKSTKILLAILALFLVSCNPQASVEEITRQSENQMSPEFSQNVHERVVVANRNSSSVSVIDAASNTVIGTFAMPDNGSPMYVVHIPQAKRVFVGDRTNNRVVAFNEDNFNVEGTIPCGNGVFHMWASPNGNQLWVNNDIDNTTTIINPVSMKVKGTAQTPSDLVAMGGKPHDVLLDPSKKFVYVSVLGLAGPNDYVVKYNTSKFEEVARIAVDKDPHLSATDQNGMLYVSCQGGSVYVLERSDLSVATIIPFAGAHGVGMANNGQFLYVADLPGNRLSVINTSSNTLVGTPVTSPFPIPHNIAINSADSKLFVTHSGATADKLSIYSLNPNPTLMTSLTLGTNPFGLVYYTYK